MRGVYEIGIRLLAGGLLGAGALAAVATTRPPLPGGRPVPVVQAASQRPTAVARGAAAGGSGRRPSEVSLLDELGRLNRPVPEREIAAWRAALHAGRVAAPRSACLRVWLGECALARDAQPQGALAQFRQAERLAGPRDAARGVAAYDAAIALYELRAYQDATDAFHRLLVSRDGPWGFDRRRCALWYRQAGACAGYHAARAALGIPEPRRLDRECGAASLAACLRALGRPCDRGTVLRACRVTGLGSTAQDLLDACGKLGLSGRAVTADETALKLLPKPLVVHVEHDHFVAVLRADDRGVVYLCSHCGPWPGGRVTLTWKQWRALEADACVAVARPGSGADRLLSAALAPRRRGSEGLRLAAAGSLARLHLAGALQMQRLVALLKSHVLLYPNAGAAHCGTKRDTTRPVPFSPKAMDGGCGQGAGPLGADPVNLANGEEEYAAAPDLVVYNPTGPPVIWQRLYNSLRGPSEDYQSDDYGVGWSHGYNVFVRVQISAPPGMAPTRTLYFADGSTLDFTPPVGQLAGPSNPDVLCTATGASPPFRIDWEYDSTTSSTAYVITFTDNTRWVFVTTVQGQDTAVKTLTDNSGLYALSRIEDPRHRLPTDFSKVSGLVFTYETGATGPNGFRHLTAISDLATGSPLLRIERSGAAPPAPPSAAPDCITRVSDGAISTATGAAMDDPLPPMGQVYWRYAQRAVSYAVGMHSLTNAVPTSPAAYAERDQVSQIAPAGAVNVPLHYAYGYQTVANGYLTEQVPFLTSITVPSPTGRGTSTAFINYDPTTDFVSSVADGNGNSRAYASPKAGDTTETQVKILDPKRNLAYSYTVSYDGLLRPTSRTDGTADNQGVNTTTVLTTSYDSTYAYRPMVVEVRTSASTSLKTQFTWTSYGRPQTVTTPRGTVDTYTWEPGQVNPNYPLGRLLKVQEGTTIAAGDQTTTMPKVATTFAYYDGGSGVQGSGWLLSVTAPAPAGSGSAVPTTLTYSNAGNVIQISGPGNATNVTNLTVGFNYTSDTTDPDGTYSQPEALGEPLTITDGRGAVSHLRYTSQGEPASVRDPSGYKTGMQYNLADQPTMISHPPTGDTGTGNATDVFSYLYPGGPQKLADRYDESGALVRRVVSLYGGEGELLGEVGSVIPMFRSYDAAYRTASVLDGDHNATRFSYSQAGNLSMITYPGGQTVQFPLYDLAGRPLKRIDGQGVEADYYYDGSTMDTPPLPGDLDGLLSHIEYPSQPDQNIHVTYDGYDRLLTRSDKSGSESYQYGDLDELTSVSTHYTGLAALGITYAYWPDGSRQTMTVPVSGSTTGNFAYTYDQAARLTGVTNPFAEFCWWEYEDNGWLRTQNPQNGVNTEYDLNPLGLLTRMVSGKSGQGALSQFGDLYPNGMHYDAAGNRLSMAASIPAAPSFSGTSSYGYSLRDELLQETTGRNGLPTQWFSYDPAGNPWVLRNNSNDYNANNQNLADTFDNNGNPTTFRGTGGYQYDLESHLTQAGSALAAGYRGDGLRAWKQPLPGGAKTYFLYDGNLPVVEFTANGSANTITAVNSFGAAGLISRRSGNPLNTSTFYTFDPQGSVCQRLDSSGAVLSSHFFDAYGQEYDQPSGTKAAPFGYGAQWGYYTDSETGLVLATNRYYDPVRARFLTRDPVGFAGGAN